MMINRNPQYILQFSPVRLWFISSKCRPISLRHCRMWHREGCLGLSICVTASLLQQCYKYKRIVVVIIRPYVLRLQWFSKAKALHLVSRWRAIQDSQASSQTKGNVSHVLIHDWKVEKWTLQAEVTICTHESNVNSHNIEQAFCAKAHVLLMVYCGSHTHVLQHNTMYASNKPRLQFMMPAILIHAKYCCPCCIMPHYRTINSKPRGA